MESEDQGNSILEAQHMKPGPSATRTKEQSNIDIEIPLSTLFTKTITQSVPKRPDPRNMKTFTASISTAIALTALVQLCPAPPAVLGPIITGALAGEAGAITGAAASGKIGKRADKFGVVERDDDVCQLLPSSFL